MKTVVIIDDHPVLAECIGLELARRNIATAIILDPSHRDAVHDLEAAKANACLIDLDLGEHQSAGLGFLRHAVAMNLPSAMFTGSDDVVVLGECLAAGAVGVVVKTQGFAQAITRIASLVCGEPVNSDTELLQWVLAAQRHHTQRKANLTPFACLSSREEEVLQHLILGARVDEIARTDYVSIATVRSQVRAILRKLHVNSQLEAVAAAHRVAWTPSACIRE